MTALLKLSPDGFEKKVGFKAAKIKWREIQEIEGVNFPKATYDESFLLVRTATAGVEVGELDKNFEAFEQALLSQLSDFPLDWKNRVEAAGNNSRISLWRR